MRRVAIVFVVGVSGCNLTSTSLSTPADAGSADAAGPLATVDASDASGSSVGWSCLGGSVPSKPASPVQVQFSFANSSMPSDAGIGGVLVQACAALDVSCAAPLADETSNDAGIAALIVSGGFAGYYQAQGPSLTPALIARLPQISSEYVAQGLTTSSLLSAAASLGGVTQDPSLSIAVVSVADCSSAPAAGVVFSVTGSSASEHVVYLENNLPSAAATQTDRASGTALIFNVPVGSLTVTATLAASGATVETLTTLARANWITYVELRPPQATYSAPH